MTALETLKNWLETYDHYSDLVQFQVDYTDQIPNNGGVFPSGLTGVSRRKDILGNTTVENQLNFGLYYVFSKAAGDDYGATENQEWIADFQEWVQTQSVTGLAPTFGDEPSREVITASNGSLYDATEEGLGIYMIQLSVKFIKKF